jgi:O-antigen ligase
VAERLRASEPYLRLLLIPVLISQFRRSGAAALIGGALVVSATVLLAASIGLFALSIDFGRGPGVPVKDYISQSGIFMLCGFALFDLAADRAAERRWLPAAAAAALALLFLIDIAVIVTSRTTLVIIPVAYLLWGMRRLSWKALAGFVVAGCVLAAVVWLASPNIRKRVMQIPGEIASHQATGEFTSSGARLEFWKSSLVILGEAPLFGHGTGSIAETFRQHTENPVAALATNPHNQIFAVGIQLGALGIAALIGMWAVHWNVFRRPGLAAWIGLLAVTQNIVGSLFNSHLMDFTQGWLYVFAVGICCGTVWRNTPQSGAPAIG